MVSKKDVERQAPPSEDDLVESTERGENVEEGQYVSPDVQAANAGEQVDMSKNIEVPTDDEKE